MKKNDLVEEWMEYAQRDILSAKYLTSMKPEYPKHMTLISYWSCVKK